MTGPGALLPLTPGQEHMYEYMHLLNPADVGATYLNQSVRLEWNGAFDLDALTAAVTAIVSRHGALRARLVGTGREVRQQIAPAAPVPVEFVDLTGSPSVMDEFAALVTTDEHAPFDVTNGPLYRITAIRIDPRRHVVVSTFHHLVFDGWSHGLYAKELRRLYRAAVAGDVAEMDPVTDYAEWVERLRAGATDPDRTAYWADRIPELPPPLRLHRLPQRSDVTDRFRYAILQEPIPSEVGPRLMRCAVDLRVSPFVVALTANAVLLHHLSDATELAFGTVVSGRDDRAASSAIGCAPNVVFPCLSIRPGDSFADVARAAQEEYTRAVAHQCSFHALVDALVSRGVAPGRLSPYEILQVWAQMNVAVPVGRPSEASAEYTVTHFPFDADNTIDWTCAMTADPARLAAFDRETPAFELEADLSILSIQYNSARYERPTIKRLARRYVDVLANGCADPAIPVKGMT